MVFIMIIFFRLKEKATHKKQNVLHKIASDLIKPAILPAYSP